MPRTLSAALLAGASLLALAGQAGALENPPACGPDPRSRCTAFKQGEVYRVVAPPGDSVTVNLFPGAEVLTVAGARVARRIDNQPPPKEWQVEYEANVVYFTPLADDIPTSSATITVRMPDNSILPHVVELNTRTGFVNLLPATASEAERKAQAENTMFLLTFDRYPAYQAAQAAKERRDRAQAEAPARAERARLAAQTSMADQLRQDVFHGSSGRRVEFEWRCQNPAPKPCGNEAIRPIRMSTNGLHMAVLFNTANDLPTAYTVTEDGKDGDTIPFHMAAPDLMVLHGSPAVVRWRRDNLVGDAREWDFRADPNANPRTGTTHPGIVRQLRPNAPSRPRPVTTAAAAGAPR